MDRVPARSDIRRDLVAILPRLRRFALALCRDESRIEHLLGKACEEAVSRTVELQGDARLDLCLFSILRRLARQDAHKLKLAEQENSGRKGAMKAARSSRLIIDMLAEDSAAAFLLCAVEGLSYREAAAVMATTEEAIAQSILNARRELKALAVNNSERRA